MAGLFVCVYWPHPYHAPPGQASLGSALSLKATVAALRSQHPYTGPQPTRVTRGRNVARCFSRRRATEVQFTYPKLTRGFSQAPRVVQSRVSLISAHSTTLERNSVPNCSHSPWARCPGSPAPGNHESNFCVSVNTCVFCTLCISGIMGRGSFVAGSPHLFSEFECCVAVSGFHLF